MTGMSRTLRFSCQVERHFGSTRRSSGAARGWKRSRRTICEPLREGMEAQGRIGRCGARSSARYGLRTERRPRSPGALPSVDRPVLIVGDTRFSSRPPLDEIIEVAVSLKACGAGGSRKRSAIRPSDETCEGINPMSAAGAEPSGQVTGKIRMTGSGTSTEKGGDA
jgi:hypothetical protein